MDTEKKLEEFMKAFFKEAYDMGREAILNLIGDLLIKAGTMCKDEASKRPEESEKL